ncbi:membrane dipeptidase [Rossellomorea marisflavi]|uniref:dipeptidase n=1 Tax=Rossellomorea marisflavi TaxID=189381 RepID=UPI001317A4B4|nr:dipeptidase [Rossellomorea marisflavi]QHA36216.1 membrane dipeptidase [Rossellomorea marisflavi]
MIIDTHCDVLMKLYMHQGRYLFNTKSGLMITYPQLVQQHSRVQLFAIFIPTHLKPGERFQAALTMVNLFHRQVISPNDKMVMVRSREDVLALEEDEIGAMLTLEGIEAIEEDMEKLEILYRLGVSSVGLTWNWANAAADGALEPRGAGLTNFGKEIITFLNDHGMWTDMSHLSEQAFWDALPLAEHPIASHSNAYTICQNPRNLKNDQIEALIAKDGFIGITFVPPFLNTAKEASMYDVIRHVDHVCSLGGEDHIGFGSDFDGIDQTVSGLCRYTDYGSLIGMLLRYFSDAQVRKFIGGNVLKRLPVIL